MRSRSSTTATATPPSRWRTACAADARAPRTSCRRRFSRCGAAARATTHRVGACATGSCGSCTIARSTRCAAAWCARVTSSTKRGSVERVPGSEHTEAQTLERRAGSHEVAGRTARRCRAEQSRVVELAYFGGFTHTEIAAMLQMPVGTVKGRMRLGLAKLRLTARRGGGVSGGESTRPRISPTVELRDSCCGDAAVYLLGLHDERQSRAFPEHARSARCAATTWPRWRLRSTPPGHGPAAARTGARQAARDGGRAQRGRPAAARSSASATGRRPGRRRACGGAPATRRAGALPCARRSRWLVRECWRRASWSAGCPPLSAVGTAGRRAPRPAW